MTVDERAAELLDTELDAVTRRKALALFDACPHTTTLLLALQEWYDDMGDEQAAAIVERFASELATHEAETE
jgi:hypothetical protein